MILEKRRWWSMSDYELLMVVFTVIGLLIAIYRKNEPFLLSNKKTA